MWRAADIYALAPSSVDAIAEAGAELASAIGEVDAALLVAVGNDAACYMASTCIDPQAHPADPTRWSNWQAAVPDLWPILADAAHLAYQRPLPPDAVRPGAFGWTGRRWPAWPASRVTHGGVGAVTSSPSGFPARRRSVRDRYLAVVLTVANVVAILVAAVGLAVEFVFR